MTEQAYHARGAGNGEPKCHCTMDVSEHCPFHGHIQFATREPGADTGTTPPRETAWLIERRDRGAIEWVICGDAGFDWTADPLKPIRFCRREDADQVASLFDDIDVHITEHRWGL